MFDSGTWVAAAIVAVLGFLGAVTVTVGGYVLVREIAQRRRARRLWREPGLTDSERGGPDVKPGS